MLRVDSHVGPCPHVHALHGAQVERRPRAARQTQRQLFLRADHLRASVDALTPKLSDTDRFYIEQLEEQYSRRISRVQYQRDLHDRLARCLYQFGDPDIRELLDAEDHETLRRMTQVLDRLSA